MFSAALTVLAWARKAGGSSNGYVPVNSIKYYYGMVLME